MPQDKIDVPPLPTPSADTGAGSADLAADLMKGFMPAGTGTGTAPEPAGGTPTPQPTPTPTKPDATPTPPKPEPPKGGTPSAAKAPEGRPAPAAAPTDFNPDDPKVTAGDLRKFVKHLKESTTLTLKEREKQIAELQGKMSDFEKRRYWTEDDLRLHEQSTKRLADLEAELYARDYSVSPEYKSKYQDRLDTIWKEAVEELPGLTVRYMEGDEEKTRAATQQDLLAVIDAPPAKRMQLAKQLFGEDRDQVLSWARDIALVRKEAAKAIEDKRTGYASEVKTRAQQFQDANQKLTKFSQDMSVQLVKAHPEIYGDVPDRPEVADALKKGFNFVDQSAQQQHTLNINDRAARGAVIRAMAGAFPRLLLEVKFKDARIAELEAKLAKFNGSDPSELGGDGGGSTPPSEGGSDSMADEIAKLK